MVRVGVWGCRRPIRLRPMSLLLLGLAVAVATVTSGAEPAAALGSPILLTVTVAPTTASVPLGETEQYAATGHYSNGTTQTLTDAVTWSTSSSTVATISNAAGSQGLATAQGTGAATISATDSAALISGTAAMTVIPAVLLTVTVSPAAANLPKGEAQQLTATGNYSNGTTQNLTDSVTWASTSSTTATVSATGLVTAVAEGAATITATAPSTSIAGASVITVITPVLVAVTVSPAVANVPAGETQQLAATGDYSDGSTQNLTDTVTWSTSSSTTATVSTTGLVTAQASGAATISATDPTSLISGTAAITVIPAVLVAVTVSPSAANVPKGKPEQLTATGNYSDGTTANITDTVTWASTSSATATVSSTGLVTAVAEGATVITATDPTTSIEGTSAITVIPATLVAVDVSPAIDDVPKGETQQLSATGVYSDGTTKNLTDTVTWSTSSSTIATVSSTGLVDGAATGAATIMATDPTTSTEGIAAITVGPANLLAVTVSPAADNLPVGEAVQLTATGDYSDGTTKNLTDEVTWASSAATDATVSNASGSEGLVTAVADGVADISATDPSGGIEGESVITVLPAVLVAVTVSPPAANVPAGETEQLTATGDYSDGSTQDITDSVTWSSSAASDASVSSTGLVTAEAEGAAAITATDPTTSIEGASAITVLPAVLLAVEVSPPAANVAAGETEQLSASGLYSDGTTKNMTDSVSWSTSSSSSATVNQKGLVTAVDTGAATITATDPSSMDSGSAVITVLPAVLLAITVSPPAADLPAGETQQLVASGLYSDGTNVDVTDSVTWSSSSNTTATVSSTGLVTALANGAAAITATDPSTGIEGAAAVTVLPAVLLAVTVTPPAADLPVGETQQLVATGDYSDGSTQVLTDSVTWSTSDSATATVSSTGLVTAVANGPATITATDTSSSIEGTAAIVVLPAVLLSISVSPTPISVGQYDAVQLTATGTYSNLSTAIITDKVTWNSDNTAIASVSNAGSTVGLLTAKDQGSTTVTATDPSTGIEGIDPVTVTGPTITLSRSEIKYRSHAKVTGDGFTPGSTVKVLYLTGLASKPKLKLCETKVSDLGTFLCKIYIPSKTTAGATGLHTVEAKILHTKGILATTTFLLSNKLN
jgi:trimeric autotransporter adhesin